MSFEKFYDDRRGLIYLLPNDDPRKEKLLKMSKYQENLNQLIAIPPNNPDSEALKINELVWDRQPGQIGPTSSLEYLMIDQFLTPLIAALEEHKLDIQQKKLNIDNELKQLNHDRMRYLNKIRSTYQTGQISFDTLKADVMAPVSESGNSFRFSSPKQLQNICKEIAKIKLANNDLPITITVRSPYNPNSSQSRESQIKEYMDNILTGTSEAGVHPKDVKIQIDGVPQTPDHSTKQYESWCQKADEKKGVLIEKQVYSSKP